MSASDQSRVAWPGTEFWDRLDHLEDRHQRIQSKHESARRGLERLSAREAEEVRQAWRHYCEVIAELDQTTAEFETLNS
jgi:hypothetical protein